MVKCTGSLVCVLSKCSRGPSSVPCSGCRPCTSVACATDLAVKSNRWSCSIWGTGRMSVRDSATLMRPNKLAGEERTKTSKNVHYDVPNRQTQKLRVIACVEHRQAQTSAGDARGCLDFSLFLFSGFLLRSALGFQTALLTTQVKQKKRKLQERMKEKE